MGKNELSKGGNNTPAYSQKDTDSTISASVTDIDREIYEPNKTTYEHVHTETVEQTISTSKRK